jgi:hypothetical protein
MTLLGLVLFLIIINIKTKKTEESFICKPSRWVSQFLVSFLFRREETLRNRDPAVSLWSEHS